MRDLIIYRLWRETWRIACIIGVIAFCYFHAGGVQAQEFFPSPPEDRALIYIENSDKTVAPLPLEIASTPLKANSVSTSDKVSYIELKGSRASIRSPGNAPRFFLFVYDRPGVHPPFLVHFIGRGSARRVTAMGQRGQTGFAISSDDIIKPLYRVVSKSDGMLFMEVRPREPLGPGEYGFIGTDLHRVATFNVGLVSRDVQEVTKK